MQPAEYPKTVVLKKQAVAVAGVVAVLLVFLTVYNVYHSAHPQPADKPANRSGVVHTVADANDTRWINEHRAQKSDEVPASTPSEMPTPPVLPSDVPVATAPDEGGVVDAHLTLQQAMAAPITSNQLIAENRGALSRAVTAASLSDPTAADAPLEQPTSVGEHHEAEVSMADVSHPPSAYLLQAGSVIPSILITGITADLPKYLVSQVRSNVYDSRSGRFLLIPQGAKLIGTYDAQIAYGQERLCVVWERILFPNGQSMTLQGMPGVDLQGYAGFTDQVNAHYGRLATGAVLSSVFGMGALLSVPAPTPPQLSPASMGALSAQSLGGTVLNTGNAWAEKQLAVQPTLAIRPGYLFNVMVTRDLVFRTPYAHDSVSH